MIIIAIQRSRDIGNSLDGSKKFTVYFQAIESNRYSFLLFIRNSTFLTQSLDVLTSPAATEKMLREMSSIRANLLASVRRDNLVEKKKHLREFSQRRAGRLEKLGNFDERRSCRKILVLNQRRGN